jgi:hypothetical protein
MTQSILKSNAQILEAIKLQTTASSIDWTPIVQAAISGISQAFGAKVTFTSPSVDLSADHAATAPAEVQRPSSVQVQIDKLASEVSNQNKILAQLSSTVDQVAKTQAQQAEMISQLSQGFNTLAQLVTKSSGTPSNKPPSGSNPPTSSTPSSTPSSAAPASTPSASKTSHLN